MSRQYLDDNGYVVGRVFQPNASQVISNPTSSTQTTAFEATTTVIRVATTGDHVHIAIGANPTATTSSMMLPSNVVDYFAVKPGWKLAAIKGGGAGSPIVSISEMI